MGARDGGPQAMVFEAVRTPRGRGKASGALRDVLPAALVRGLVEELRERVLELDPRRLDDLVLGVATPVGEQGIDLVRDAVSTAGIPEFLPGMQVNRFCSSGLEAVNIAAQKVRSGWENLLLAGGVESMSRVPAGSDGGTVPRVRSSADLAGGMPGGIVADLLATLEGLDRVQVDAFALRSQTLARRARAAGPRRSVVPVRAGDGRTILAEDELPRPGLTPALLASLPPAHAVRGTRKGHDRTALRRYPHLERIDHVHTAGNSAAPADGAALLLVGSDHVGEELGMRPRARVLSAAVCGADRPARLLGTVPATRRALLLAGLTVQDVDLFEVHEAHAAVVLRYVRELKIPEERVNVNGGAIALGDPLGATGAMLLTDLLDEMGRRNARSGLVAMGTRNGTGVVTILESC